MRKIFSIVLATLFLLSFYSIVSAQIVAWNSYNSPSSYDISFSATTNDVNLNTPILSRGTGVTATSLSHGYSSKGWTDADESGAITNNRYYQVTVNAKFGYSVFLSTLDSHLRRTSTGPNAYIWRFSIDGTNFTDIGSQIDFTTTTSSGDDQPQIDLSGISDLQNVGSSTTIYLRLYAWGASGGSGSFALGTTNVNSLSLDGVIALPVELTDFSAYSTENSVTLKWQTATEINNYGFDVERKKGNKNWSKIGFVAGSGNSNSPKSYSFTDRPTGGTKFSYRLKQIDVDGKFKYYDAVTVSLNGSEQAKLLQNNPNPFNPSTAIKFYIPSDLKVKIVIYDILGREVAILLNEQKQAGYHIVYWNGNDKNGIAAASGVYLYKLTADNYVETKKMNLLK